MAVNLLPSFVFSSSEPSSVYDVEETKIKSRNRKRSRSPVGFPAVQFSKKKARKAHLDKPVGEIVKATRIGDVITQGKKKYTIINHICDGSTGTIKLGKDQHDHEVAIKEYDSGNSAVWENEAVMLKLVASRVRYAVRLLDVFKDNANREYIVTSLHGNSLADCMLESDSLLLDDVLTIADQLLEFLSGMKEAGLIHADLKPHNILSDDNKEKKKSIIVVDFGLAKKEEDDNKSKLVQTLRYRAPEVIVGKSYDHQIDMWSLGCILFELYTQNYFIHQIKGDLSLQSYTDVLKQICVRGSQKIPNSWIENSLNGCKIFEKKDGEYLFKLKPSPGTEGITPLDHRILHQAKQNKESEKKAEAFGDLLKRMLTFENRISPEEAHLALKAIREIEV